MPREITTDGVIVIDHEELRGADVVSLLSERDRYANWKRQCDKRIAAYEHVALEWQQGALDAETAIRKICEIQKSS